MNEIWITEDRGDYVEVLPIGDTLRKHVQGDECWCDPEVERTEDSRPLITHHEAAGEIGMNVPEKWQVTKEPDDDVLRISVGGLNGKFGYVVFRGNAIECNRLLVKASEELSRYILANKEESKS